MKKFDLHSHKSCESHAEILQFCMIFWKFVRNTLNVARFRFFFYLNIFSLNKKVIASQIFFLHHDKSCKCHDFAWFSWILSLKQWNSSRGGAIFGGKWVRLCIWLRQDKGFKGGGKGTLSPWIRSTQGKQTFRGGGEGEV